VTVKSALHHALIYYLVAPIPPDKAPRSTRVPVPSNNTTKTLRREMALSKHVDPDELIKSLHDHPIHKASHNKDRFVSHVTPYSSRYASSVELSKFQIPHDGAPAEVVHQLLKDELDLDGVR
jgi:hypothetical protein